jgi:benzoate/toluate 1,2-dioxygenase beta subunit
MAKKKSKAVVPTKAPKGPRGGTLSQRQAANRGEKVPRLRRRSDGSARDDDRHDTLREVEQLLYRQAESLDGKRWQEFIDLFTEDGTYWMPAAPEQTTGDGVPSIFWEDRNLMTVRAKRLGHPRAWSQKTAWGTNHVVGNVTLLKEDGRTGDLVVRSRFHMMEFRNDATRHFAGSYIHHLKKTKAGHRIKLQRVDMVNAQGPYDYVLQAWV